MLGLRISFFSFRVPASYSRIPSPYSQAFVFLSRFFFFAAYDIRRFTGRDAGLMGVRGADLLAGTGELTQVGTVFVEKYQDLQRCQDFSSSIASSQPSGSVMASNDAGGSADVAGE